MANVSIAQPPERLRATIDTLTGWATREEVLADAPEVDAATAALAEVQQMRRRVKAFFADLRRPINEARAVNLRNEQDWLGKLAPIEDRLTRLIVAYQEQAATRQAAAAAQLLATATTTGTLPETPLEIAVPVTPSQTRTTYAATVATPEDFQVLVAAVAAGRVPLMALKPDETWLSSRAREQRERLAIPGVTLVVKKTVVT